MPLTIIREDISKLTVDAIVNPTNHRLQIGGGVCGAIFQAAGWNALQAACDKLAPVKTGEAVITPGFQLPAKYVIHTVGPIYRGGKRGEEAQLHACYVNSMKRAAENNCESIAFPLIASGRNGFPNDVALRVARESIQQFLCTDDMDVYLVVFDKAAITVREKLVAEIKSYIDEHDISIREDVRPGHSPFDLSEAIGHRPSSSDFVSCEVFEAPAALYDLVENLDESFSEWILRLIDAKGMTDVEVYKRANIDRRLFSKIRTNREYTPSKRTAIALAIALKLSLAETEDLLRRAGYALSRSHISDVIITYFIVTGKYDIFEINEVLFEFDQDLLGG